jgi:signal transduction histidine kinase
MTTTTTETTRTTEVEPRPPGAGGETSGETATAGRPGADDARRLLPPAPRLARRLRRRWLLSGIRPRIVVAFVGLLLLATVASILLVRQVLVERLEDRVHAELVQEATELSALAGTGIDPETGQPFGRDVRRIFRVFLERNVPAQHEVLLTFVDGEPFLRSRRVTPYRLDRDPELVARWSAAVRSDRGRVATPAGAVEYLAVPVVTAGETRGVFVVAHFMAPHMREIHAAIAAAGVVGLVVLLLGSVFVWRVSDSVLRPVRSVTGTARAISETDLGGRIDVRGDDEVADLAETFNDMLDRLEAAFATQRRFVDDAGHELRTPITIIRGHLELLEDDPEERRATVDLVMDELDRMSRIVNDLLLLAKAQEPDFLRLENVDVESLTVELQEKAKALAPRAWRLDHVGRGRIVADRQRLTQAIVQLAQNAVQHTEEHGAIALGSILTEGYARFWVHDSGRGIPHEEQEAIFDRFARGAEGRRSDGAGLGLSIVRAIAEAHHGRVEVSSRPGDGATFTLVVPVDEPEDARAEGDAPE